MAIPPPFHLSLTQFLKGEDSTSKLDIDPVFGTPFDKFLKEHAEYFPTDYNDNQVSFLKKSAIDPTISYYHSWYGVIMITGNHQPIGCYLWTSLTLDPEWQGKGLGRELVVNRCLQSQDNPVWVLDKPEYSPAGLACHMSAWRWVRNYYS